MKTLSQASFSKIPSGTNLQTLANSYQNLNNGPSNQMSLTVPGDTNNYMNGSEKNNGLSGNGIGDQGMLEFVKVDVDNNMVIVYSLCFSLL